MAVARVGGPFREHVLLQRLIFGPAIARAGFAVVRDGHGSRKERDWLVPEKFWQAHEANLQAGYGSFGRCGFSDGTLEAAWGDRRSRRSAAISDLQVCWDEADLPKVAVPQIATAERVAIEAMCVDWLKRGFADADTAQVKRDQWKAVAKERFPSLSNDGFDYAWTAAASAHPERSNKGRSKLDHEAQIQLARGVG